MKYRFNKETSMLLIIDVQKKLLESMKIKDQSEVVDNTLKLLMTADIFEMPVVVTEQYPQGLGRTVEPICNLLNNHKSHQYFTKTCFNAADLDDFSAHLNNAGKRNVIVTGMESHICVLQTVMNLIENNYNVIVASDAVCSRKKNDKKRALQAMRDAGAVIYPSETIMYMLTQKSDIPEFKKILELVKNS